MASADDHDPIPAHLIAGLPIRAVADYGGVREAPWPEVKDVREAPFDDASRVAYAQLLTEENAECTVVFLRAAVAYYAGLGVRIRGVYTDNANWSLTPADALRPSRSTRSCA